MRAELKALEEVLDTGRPAGRVFLGEPPKSAPLPYVLLVGQRNEDEPVRLTGPRAREVIQVLVRSIGGTSDQSMWADDAVDATLRPNKRGIRLQVPGRRCTPIERRTTDTDSDDSAGRVWETATSYRFTSTPA